MLLIGRGKRDGKILDFAIFTWVVLSHLEVKSGFGVKKCT